MKLEKKTSKKGFKNLSGNDNKNYLYGKLSKVNTFSRKCESIRIRGL